MRTNGVRDLWLHNRQNGDGCACLKLDLVGPSETIPILDGECDLSIWRRIVFFELDGPRSKQRIVRMVMAALVKPLEQLGRIS